MKKLLCLLFTIAASPAFACETLSSNETFSARVYVDTGLCIFAPVVGSKAYTVYATNDSSANFSHYVIDGWDTAYGMKTIVPGDRLDTVGWYDPASSWPTSNIRFGVSAPTSGNYLLMFLYDHEGQALSVVMTDVLDTSDTLGTP